MQVRKIKYLTTLLLTLILSANAWAEEGTTYKDLFEQIKDELTTLRCSGNTSTTISFIGETPVEESTGTYSEYYYFNDDFFYRNRMGRIEALGEFRVFEGWLFLFTVKFGLEMRKWYLI